MNVPIILPLLFFLWVVCFPCHAFQYPRSWGSLETSEMYGFPANVTNLQLDDHFDGTFSQTTPPNSLSEKRNHVDGDIESDLSILLSIFSEIPGQFSNCLFKSWGNFFYGVCYQHRNLFPLLIWNHLVPHFSRSLIQLLLNWLGQLRPSMHDSVIRVCGNVMFEISCDVLTMINTLGFPLAWLLRPRFHWQQQHLTMYHGTIFAPIWEEMVHRLILHQLWIWNQDNARKMNVHFGGKLQGQSKVLWSNYMGLLEHKYSFRILSSLTFGIVHIAHYYHLRESNEIDLQKDFVLRGLKYAVSAFFHSFFCLTPLFETKGVTAVIGAHAAWNLMVLWKDGILLRPMFILAVGWSLDTLQDTDDLLKELTQIEGR